MTNAPGEVSPDQLKELNIRLRQKAKAETATE
jgi:aspartyl-tRNA synthetase